MPDTPTGDPFGIDRFPVGCIATDSSRKIRFANAYAAAQVGRPTGDLLGLNLEALLTPASRIFCDSYVYPILLTEGHCDEIALTFATGSDGRASVTVNVRVHGGDPDLVLWSFMLAEKRNRLEAEVLNARNMLQKQARALKELAARDELTGLLNRREFTNMALQLFAAADRAGATVAIFLLDIDRFKAVNDTHGHQAGDDVLRQLGAAFAQTCRTHEIAGRYGGEEFVFADDAEAAHPFSRRLHAAAASVTGAAAPVTVSIGLSCRAARSGRSFEQVVQAADQALYRAKALGRDRTIIESDGALFPLVQQEN